MADAKVLCAIHGSDTSGKFFAVVSRQTCKTGVRSPGDGDASERASEPLADN